MELYDDVHDDIDNDIQDDIHTYDNVKIIFSVLLRFDFLMGLS